MDTIKPADFKGFYRSLDAEARKRFAELAQTTVGHIETHWQYARKIPNPTRMERLYMACVQFGASFSKPELIAFFYEPNKDREIKTSALDRMKASDDVQPPAGGPDRTKRSKMVI
ncbi:hypothetical protein [Burkholderia multivorans]|uniref:hypothetical protein n=1 Tax=Burkholderia multivorans TaxID=87883 RepID=UPI000CFF3A2F|nr:hypothetical protein [Burkholderia multivorans]PRE20316.1 hypothetical protein C6P78_03750 [Burkholderia multivorans]